VNPSSSPIICFDVTGSCLRLVEWVSVSQIFGVIFTSIIGIIGIVKVFSELSRIKDQRRKEAAALELAAKLKRTEFFLSQHRRLFDDSKLFEVLCLLDSDDWKLAEKIMWDSNRKFLTFIEEIQLLIGAGQINSDVAYYMFGYYAQSARTGPNFNVGINSRESYWRLFNEFCDSYVNFQNKLDGDSSYFPRL
jgi:hypothetical protein